MLQRKHFAAFAALQFFGSYRTNNGHHRTLVRRGSVAIDPQTGHCVIAIQPSVNAIAAAEVGWVRAKAVTATSGLSRGCGHWSAGGLCYDGGPVIFLHDRFSFAIKCAKFGSRG